MLSINPDIDGYLQEQTTLQCHYHSDNQWILMQWLKRQAEDGPYVPIVSILQNSTTPVWRQNATVGFKNRVQTYIRRKYRHTYFYLMFAIQCDDPAMYKCSIVGINEQLSKETRISVQAFPLQPTIDKEDSDIQINSSYTLDCFGNVGLPAAQLQWYYKSRDDTLFSLAKDQEKLVLRKSHDCRFLAERRLTIYIDSDSDGDVYRCAVDGKLVSSADARYYSEFTVRLIEEETEPPLQMCLDESCYAKHEESVSQTAERSHVVNLLVIVSIIYTALHYLDDDL